MAEQTLHFADEELAELVLLLKREIASTSVELRHTTTRDYREFIRRRMDMITAILSKVEDAQRVAHA